VLQRGHVVRGTVRDDKGRRVAGANIQGARNDPAAITDSNGRYELKAARPGDLWLQVQAGGCAVLRQRITLDKDTTVDFRMEPGKEIRVKLRDEKDRPVRRGWVNFAPDNRSGSRSFRMGLGFPDSDGVVTWDEAPATPVFAYAVVNDSATEKVKVCAGEEVTIVIPSAPPPLVMVKVTDAATGQPLSGCTVSTGTLTPGSAQPYWPSWLPKTTGEPMRHAPAEGEFFGRIDGHYLPYELMFRVKRDGYTPVITAPLRVSGDKTTVPVALHQRDSCDATILRLDGSPAKHAAIYVTWRGNALELSDFILDRTEYSNRYLEHALVAGEDGHCAVPPCADDASVLMTHEDGFAAMSYADLMRNSTVKLQPYGQVQVIVRDQGRPAPGVKLEYQNSMILPGKRSVTLLVHGETDAGGRVVLPRVFPSAQGRLSEVLPPFHEGEDLRLITAQESQAVVAARTTTYEIETKAAVARVVMGRFVLPENAMFSGPSRGGNHVSLKRPRGTTAATTDFYREGRFQFDAVAPGEYRLWIPSSSSAPFRYTLPDNGELSVFVPQPAPGESARAIDLGDIDVVDRRDPAGAIALNTPGRLAVRVLREGKPVLDDRGLALVISGEPDSAGSSTAGSAPQAQDFLKRTVRPGRKLLQVGYAAQDGTCWFSPLITTQVKGGSDVEVTASLQPGIGLTGRVAEDMPRPIKDARIAVYVSPDGDESFQSICWFGWMPLREDGSFEFASLPPGQVRLHVFSDGWISPIEREDNRRSRPWFACGLTQSRGAVVVPVQRTATCDITVVNAQGDPVAGAAVSMPQTLFWKSLGTLLPGQDGAFLQEGMAKNMPNVDLAALFGRRPELKESFERAQVLLARSRILSGELESARIVTDSQGHATLRGIPPNSNASSINISLSGARPSAKSTRLEPLQPGEAVQRTIRLDQ